MCGLAGIVGHVDLTVSLAVMLHELARRRLGERVADAPKQGSAVLVEDWIAGRWSARVRESLRDPMLMSQGWESKSGTEDELASSARSGRASRRLWYLSLLEEWMRIEAGGVGVIQRGSAA